jgi:hypothetical protein
VTAYESYESRRRSQRDVLFDLLFELEARSQRDVLFDLLFAFEARLIKAVKVCCHLPNLENLMAFLQLMNLRTLLYVIFFDASIIDVVAYTCYFSLPI